MSPEISEEDRPVASTADGRNVYAPADDGPPRCLSHGGRDTDGDRICGLYATAREPFRKLMGPCRWAALGETDE